VPVWAEAGSGGKRMRVISVENEGDEGGYENNRIVAGGITRGQPGRSVSVCSAVTMTESL
jgi:hypothetical protein